MTSIGVTSSAPPTLLSTPGAVASGSTGAANGGPSTAVLAAKDAAKAADAASVKAAEKLAQDQQAAVNAAQTLVDQRAANNAKIAAQTADAKLQAAEKTGGGLDITA